jgi:hypothetical protein
MALSDVAANFDSGVPWRTCATCHALSGMSEDDAAVLVGLLSNRNVRYKELAAELRRDPDSPTIEWDALSRHARGECVGMKARGERLRA